MRRPLATVLALLTVAMPVASAEAGTPSPTLQRKLARALHVPHVSPVRSAALAVDLATGTVLYTQNGSRALAPASNEKLPVTFAALSVLGPAYRFETDVVGQGGQDGTVWTGEIVLEGAGDPTLSSAGLRNLALQVRAAGIAVTGRVRVGVAQDFSIPLASVSSPPLSSIVRFMDRESDNFTAEMLLKQLGAIELDHGTSAAGSSVVSRVLTEAGIPMTGVRIVDGSGLSRFDRLTAGALTTLLREAWTDPVIKPVLLAALPVAGVSGTLQDRMRRGPAHGNVAAKTGTTNDASALSGFVRNRFAFAVVQNGHPLSYWWARIAQDRFAQVLAAQ